MAEALLELDRLNRRFGGLHAVRDLTFSVPEGSIAGLIGPNGAGKTTAFNLISGALQSESGTVRFAGRAITNRRPWAIATLGIARTFQTTRLFPHMTVLENVMVGRHVRSRAGFVASILRLPGTRAEERGIRARAIETLEKLELGPLSGELAGNLPFGSQRLVEVARALAMEPRLLLLDEPAAGLNIHETTSLGRLVRRIRDWGVTVLLVEHDMSLVMEVCDRVIAMDRGREIAEGSPAEVQRNPDVIRVYLGEDGC